MSLAGHIGNVEEGLKDSKNYIGNSGCVSRRGEKMGIRKTGGIHTLNSLGEKKAWSKQSLDGRNVGSEGIAVDWWEKELIPEIPALPRSRG